MVVATVRVLEGDQVAESQLVEAEFGELRAVRRLDVQAPTLRRQAEASADEVRGNVRDDAERDAPLFFLRG